MPLSASGVKRALKAIDRSTAVGKRDYALLSVAMTTGRRVAELAAMCMEDVTVGADGKVLLTRPRTKGNKLMRDTLSTAVGNALLDYLHTAYDDKLSTVSPDAPVWISNARNSNRGGPLGVQGIANVCEKQLGVSKSHVLRHTFAHNLEEAGAKLSEIQARLGHASAATTSKYLVALRSDENPYSEQLAAMFGVD
jgi:integrase